MGQFTKIATCNYCGTRAALVLGGNTRHELVCSGCGAPLHDLKAFKVAPGKPTKPHGRIGQDTKKPKKSKSPKNPRQKTRAHEKPRDDDDRRDDYKRRKPKRKGGFKRFLSEAIDVIEDIFD